METTPRSNQKTAGINRGLVALAAQLAVLIASLILAQVPGANKGMLNGFSMGLLTATVGTALFILIANMRRNRIRNTPDERQQAIKDKSGLAALLSTITLAIAFILASMTIPALRSFNTTILATTAVLFMGLSFVTALLINTQRM